MQGIFGFSRVEELEMAIGNCKEAVKTSLENSENRRKMVAKLVQLRLKLLQLQVSVSSLSFLTSNCYAVLILWPASNSCTVIVTSKFYPAKFATMT